MAHDIDTSTGMPAVAYVGEEPWHGLGEKPPEDAPIEIWLKAARLEWKLNRLPVQYLVDGTLKTMEDRFVLVRNDTRAGLSIVSGEYQIVQPGEVLEFYRDLMTNYGYILETAGALDGGRKVWALARTGLATRPTIMEKMKSPHTFYWPRPAIRHSPRRPRLPASGSFARTRWKKAWARADVLVT